MEYVVGAHALYVRPTTWSTWWVCMAKYINYLVVAYRRQVPAAACQ